jgi:hypothetical protein
MYWFLSFSKWRVLTHSHWLYCIVFSFIFHPRRWALITRPLLCYNQPCRSTSQQQSRCSAYCSSNEPHHTTKKKTMNNAVEAKSSPPPPEPQLPELQDRTRDCMVGTIQPGSVMMQTQQSTTVTEQEEKQLVVYSTDKMVTCIWYCTSIMRLILITMFKLILRLVVHGNAQYGYDYDATIK